MAAGPGRTDAGKNAGVKPLMAVAKALSPYRAPPVKSSVGLGVGAQIHVPALDRKGAIQAPKHRFVGDFLIADILAC